MRVSRRRLYFFSAIILLVLVILLVSVQIMGQGKNFTCEQFSDRYPKSHCGYLDTDNSGVFNRVIGVVSGKSVSSGGHAFMLKTKDSKGRVINIKIDVAPDPLLKRVVHFTPRKDFKPGMRIDPSDDNLTTERFYNQLKIGDAVIVGVLVLDQGQLKAAKAKFGDLKFFSCVDYQRQYIQYLKDSSLYKYFLLKVAGLRSGCSLSTLEIEL